jgi:hypothetical protein
MESEDFALSTFTFIFHELSIAEILGLVENLERGCFMSNPPLSLAKCIKERDSIWSYEPFIRIEL